MKIRLDADYRGELTGETYYKAGDYTIGADMPEQHGTALVEAGRAVVVESVKVTPPAPRTVTKRKGQL